MSEQTGFSRFVGLNEDDAPHLLQRMSAETLPVDGERYGVDTRLIARDEVSPADLGTAVLQKLLRTLSMDHDEVGAVVLSSRIVPVQEAAEEIVQRLSLNAQALGIERACSGFPAATDLAIRVCRELQQPVAVVTAEVISPSINWEPAEGQLADQARARGQASKLFGDGAAAVMVLPSTNAANFEILDAWAGEVADEKQLIQKTAVEDSMDPWGKTRPGATDCMSMPGRRGFLLVRRAPSVMAESLQKSLQRVSQLDASLPPVAHVVPHQANGLIIERLASELDGGETLKVWNCIRDAGNTVSASIPLAMSEVQDEIPAGAMVGMPSVGAGGPGYRPEILSTGCVIVKSIGNHAALR